MQEPRAVVIINKLVNAFVMTLLLLFLLFGVFSLWDIYSQFEAGNISTQVLHLKPGEPDYSFTNILQTNGDVRAWLTLDGTKVDYPVLQGKDNAEYLDKNLYGDYYVGGSIFIDYRCDGAFADFYTLLHGHHMDQGAMFGDLEKYAGEEFFAAHSTGTLYTPVTRYRLEIFAYMSIDAYDEMIYTMPKTTEETQQQLLQYVAANAQQYRDIGVTTEDRVLAMSTCSSAFTNSRSVVLARMVSEGANDAGVIKDIEEK